MSEASPSGDTPDGVAVVTVRSTATMQNATFELLEIINEITTVALITTVISQESPVCQHHEYIEISQRGTGGNVLISAVRFLKNQLLFCLAIWRRDEEAVLFFGATAYVLPIVFARLLGRLVIVEPRGDVPLTLRLQWEERIPTTVASILAGLVRIQERLGYAVASAIITYTPSMAKELNIDAYSRKLYPAGARYVPTDRFNLQTPYAERDRQIGYVGRLDVEKGIHTLVDVISHLPQDVTFKFVGDGASRDQVEAKLAADLDAGRVEITGWIDQSSVASELNQLRLVVMPSQPTEGLPTTILEAFACGTPVYATPVSGVPDVVHEGETGFLMTDDDPEAIAETIQTILDRDDLPKISQQCQDLIQAEYTFEATVERYRRMFREISESK